MTSRLLVLAYVVMAAGLGQAPACAQNAPFLTPGARLRVTRAYAPPFVVRYIGVTTDSLLFELEVRPVQHGAVPLSSITQLEVWEDAGGPSLVGPGIAVGLVAGTIIGAAQGADNCTSFCLFPLSAGEKGLQGAVVGAVLGAAIGTALSRSRPAARWQRVALR